MTTIEVGPTKPPFPGEQRRAPVQAHGAPGGVAGTVDWEEHCAAWELYAQRYGREQSVERIAERGGFSYSELVLFLGRTPTTWQPAA